MMMKARTTAPQDSEIQNRGSFRDMKPTDGSVLHFHAFLQGAGNIPFIFSEGTRQGMKGG